jgi:hypothetical protein
MRKPIEQIAVLPLIKDARLSQAAKMEKRIGPLISVRDQFEHPHFRGAKPRRAGGKFFEQVKQDRPQQRQSAQILAQQIEAGFRSRRPVGLPGRAGGLKHIPGDVDGRHLPSAICQAPRESRYLNRSRRGAISNGPRSPDENENSRAAKPAAIGRSGSDQTIARPPHSAGRTRPIPNPCGLRWHEATGYNPTSERPGRVCPNAQRHSLQARLERAAAPIRSESRGKESRRRRGPYARDLCRTRSESDASWPPPAYAETKTGA